MSETLPFVSLPMHESDFFDDLKMTLDASLIQVEIPLSSDVREVLRSWTSRRMRRFVNASNTEVLSNTHAWGIYRGLAGEYAVSQWLQRPTTGSLDSPFDLRAWGKRLDVKTTKHGLPLMIPATQEYKLEAGRDVFVLAWFDGNEDCVSIIGRVSVGRFAREAKRDAGTRFPIPTLYMEVADLDPLEEAW